MSADEFRQWQVFYQYEPFGQEWKQTALACAVTANSAMGRKRPLKVKDFMPCLPPKQRQTDEQIQAFFEGLCQPLRAAKKTSEAETGKSASTVKACP